MRALSLLRNRFLPKNLLSRSQDYGFCYEGESTGATCVDGAGEGDDDEIVACFDTCTNGNGRRLEEGVSQISRSFLVQFGLLTVRTTRTVRGSSEHYRSSSSDTVSTIPKNQRNFQRNCFFAKGRRALRKVVHRQRGSSRNTENVKRRRPARGGSSDAFQARLAFEKHAPSLSLSRRVARRRRTRVEVRARGRRTYEPSIAMPPKHVGTACFDWSPASQRVRPPRARVSARQSAGRKYDHIPHLKMGLRSLALDTSSSFSRCGDACGESWGAWCVWGVWANLETSYADGVLNQTRASFDPRGGCWG